MIIPERFKKFISKNKTKEELDKHYENVKLEKGDFLAMVIAAFITFFPVLIIAMVIIYGLAWIFMVR